MLSYGDFWFGNAATNELRMSTWDQPYALLTPIMNTSSDLGDLRITNAPGM